jgi:hypothetical protein
VAVIRCILSDFVPSQEDGSIGRSILMEKSGSCRLTSRQLGCAVWSPPLLSGFFLFVPCANLHHLCPELALTPLISSVIPQGPPLDSLTELDNIGRREPNGKRNFDEKLEDIQTWWPQFPYFCLKNSNEKSKKMGENAKQWKSTKKWKFEKSIRAGGKPFDRC